MLFSKHFLAAFKKKHNATQLGKSPEFVSFKDVYNSAGGTLIPGPGREQLWEKQI